MDIGIIASGNPAIDSFGHHRTPQKNILFKISASFRFRSVRWCLTRPIDQALSSSNSSSSSSSFFFFLLLLLLFFLFLILLFFFLLLFLLLLLLFFFSGASFPFRRVVSDPVRGKP